MTDRLKQIILIITLLFTIVGGGALKSISLLYMKKRRKLD